MITAVLILDIYIPSAHSLKEKRAILRQIKDKVKGNFPVAVGELDGQNMWQTSKLGFAIVTSDNNFARSVFSKIENHIINNPLVSIVNTRVEII